MERGGRKESKQVKESGVPIMPAIYLPKVECAHNISTLQKLASDKAYDWVVVAPTERSIWVCDDSPSDSF